MTIFWSDYCWTRTWNILWRSVAQLVVLISKFWNWFPSSTNTALNSKMRISESKGFSRNWIVDCNFHSRFSGCVSIWGLEISSTPHLHEFDQSVKLNWTTNRGETCDIKKIREKSFCLILSNFNMNERKVFSRERELEKLALKKKRNPNFFYVCSGTDRGSRTFFRFHFPLDPHT